MKNFLKTKTLFLSLTAFAFFALNLQAEEQIRIVGSSTVFPFSTAVAEEFGRTTKYKTPIVESTGSGGGMKLFCTGLGPAHPDITNASRRIKDKEYQKCTKAGIKIIEMKVGYDGIVLANSKKGNVLNLTTRDIYLALAEKVPANEDGSKLQDNPYKTWKDVNSNLPNIKIEVLGPPPTSGTRDAFVELAMDKGAKSFSALKELRGSSKAGKSEFKKIARTMREDGAFIEAGENDNLKKTLDGHIRIESEPNENGVTEVIDIQPNQQAKIVVGYLEKSNVNAVEEMVNTIDQQRKFEMHVKFIQMAEELDSVGASLMRMPGM